MLRTNWLWGALAGLALAAPASAQFYESDLVARARVFPEVGPGVRAVKRDAQGRAYVLVSLAAARGGAAASAVLLYDASGKQIGQIPAPATQNSKTPPLVYGVDFDVDSAGRVYIADRGGDAVKVFNPDGSLALSIPFAAPTSLVALTDHELGVASTKSDRLVTVFLGPGAPASPTTMPGKLVREFGAPAEIAERPELNRFLNIGRLAADPAGHIYYAFSYVPEPTVRKYDRYGYAAQEITLTALEFQPVAQAARREIGKQAKSGTPRLKPIITAVGVDPATEEVWIAMGNVIVHFDREGNRRGTYRAYTAEGVRVEPVAILVEADRVILAADPLGVYEFPRPDKPAR